jgi:hypothetical protein
MSSTYKKQPAHHHDQLMSFLHKKIVTEKALNEKQVDDFRHNHMKEVDYGNATKKLENELLCQISMFNIPQMLKTLYHSSKISTTNRARILDIANAIQNLKATTSTNWRKLIEDIEFSTAPKPMTRSNTVFASANTSTNNQKIPTSLNYSNASTPMIGIISTINKQQTTTCLTPHNHQTIDNILIESGILSPPDKTTYAAKLTTPVAGLGLPKIPTPKQNTQKPSPLQQRQPSPPHQQPPQQPKPMAELPNTQGRLDQAVNNTDTNKRQEELFVQFRKCYSASLRYTNHIELLTTHLDNNTYPKCLGPTNWRLPHNIFRDKHLQLQLENDCRRIYISTSITHINTAIVSMTTRMETMKSELEAINPLNEDTLRDLAAQLESEFMAKTSTSWDKERKIITKHFQSKSRPNRTAPQAPVHQQQYKKMVNHKNHPNQKNAETQEPATKKSLETQEPSKNQKEEKRVAPQEPTKTRRESRPRRDQSRPKYPSYQRRDYSRPNYHRNNSRQPRRDHSRLPYHKNSRQQQYDHSRTRRYQSKQTRDYSRPRHDRRPKRHNSRPRCESRSYRDYSRPNYQSRYERDHNGPNQHSNSYHSRDYSRQRYRPEPNRYEDEYRPHRSQYNRNDMETRRPNARHP